VTATVTIPRLDLAPMRLTAAAAAMDVSYETMVDVTVTLLVDLTQGRWLSLREGGDADTLIQSCGAVVDAANLVLSGADPTIAELAQRSAVPARSLAGFLMARINRRGTQ
jgi:hypothetical protein